MIRELLAVGCGGAAGSIARYLLSYYLLAGHTSFGFPAGTFVVNLIGSLLIGILLTLLDSATSTWLLVVGFCGGFTTFSTFSVDVVHLLQGGNYLTATLYITASVVICVVFVAAGMWFGQLLKINL